MIGVIEAEGPGEIRTCPDCGKGYETYHEPPAEKCPGCRYVYQDCATCGRPFGLDPLSTSIELFGPDCLADDCDSYDIDRDPTAFFAPDDPDLIEEAR